MLSDVFLLFIERIHISGVVGLRAVGVAPVACRRYTHNFHSAMKSWSRKSISALDFSIWYCLLENLSICIATGKSFNAWLRRIYLRVSFDSSWEVRGCRLETTTSKWWLSIFHFDRLARDLQGSSVISDKCESEQSSIVETECWSSLIFSAIFVHDRTRVCGKKTLNGIFHFRKSKAWSLKAHKSVRNSNKENGCSERTTTTNYRICVCAHCPLHPRKKRVTHG